MSGPVHQCPPAVLSLEVCLAVKTTNILSREIPQAYNLLRWANGCLNWWPGDTAIEIIVGAILTQNTAWTNVQKAIGKLRCENLLSVPALRHVENEALEQAIRPSGYFRQKTKKLKAFINYIDSAFGGSLDRMNMVPTQELRRELLSVWGIGPETADSILLYAFNRSVFVVDTYTKRIACRHEWALPSIQYEELQNCFIEHLPEETALYNDYHAQIVKTGKDFCRPNPNCDSCPLRQMLSGSRWRG